MTTENELLPLARINALVIKELQDEVLVYDLERHKAHCLNPTAASVWRLCDGKLTVPDMTRLLKKKFDTPVKDEVIWLALQQLDKFHLLQERGKVSRGRPGLSRRDLVRRIGISALLLPAIISITAPPAAQAQSGGKPNGVGCESGAECKSGCCSDAICNDPQACAF